MIGALPRHHYVWVDTRHTHITPQGFVPAVWFGLVSFPGRMWGCNVLLESGAVYRNLPPHALAFSQDPKAKEKEWTEKDAQVWDCYGYAFSCLEYPYLHGLEAKARWNGWELMGDYLFTVAPIGDGFSAYPEQAKEFTAIQLENDRLTIQPTNHVLFRDRSFTRNKEMEFPADLKRQTDVWQCE
jgi:hypothetical protein